MEDKKYYITQEQLERIDHFKEMFRYESDNLRDLCSSEKDDVVYGYQMGQTSANLSECHMNLMLLISDEIKKQTL